MKPEEVKKEEVKKENEIITDSETQELEGGVSKESSKDDDTAPGNGGLWACC